MLFKYSWDNIAQVKSLCNIVQEAPDIIAQEKFLFNFVLILLDNIAQVKSLSNVVQEARDSVAQEKFLFNFVLILLGQHCTGKQNPCTMLSKWLETT